MTPRYLTLLSLVLFAIVSCSTPARDDRPNIVLILADDMGYSDIGAFGGEISTPNLDALAAQGLRFTEFYNGARCCPTRASLLTGLYAQQTGVGHMTDTDNGLFGYRGELNDQSLTIAEVLKSAGYGTYMSGKWHVTSHLGFWTDQDSLTSTHNWPLQRGFDRFFGTINGAGSFFNPNTLTSGNSPVPGVTDGFHYTEAITDSAVHYIRSHVSSGKDTPFFAYVAFTAPHWPLHAFPEDIERMHGQYDEGWEVLRQKRFANMRAMGILDSTWTLSPPDELVTAWDSLSEQEQTWYSRAMEVYAAQVHQMDRGIGRILETLDQSGLNENTIVIFLSDNGGCQEVLTDGWRGHYVARETQEGEPVHVGNQDKSILPGPENTYMSYGRGWANASNTPFRMYKHFVHEGGIATPFIVRWPEKIKETGGVVRQPAHLIDLMATAVDVSGATYPPVEFSNSLIFPMEGKSLAPFFNNETMEQRPLFWEHEGNRAIRDGNWKLVAKHGGPWELFNIAEDRTEQHDLAEIETERKARMLRQYQEWAARAFVVDWPPNKAP